VPGEADKLSCGAVIVRRVDRGWLTSRADGTNRRYASVASRLDAPLRSLWLLIRKETSGTAAAQQDERRLAQVLAIRRSRSEEGV